MFIGFKYYRQVFKRLLCYQCTYLVSAQRGRSWSGWFKGAFQCTPFHHTCSTGLCLSCRATPHLCTPRDGRSSSKVFNLLLILGEIMRSRSFCRLLNGTGFRWSPCSSSRFPPNDSSLVRTLTSPQQCTLCWAVSHCATTSSTSCSASDQAPRGSWLLQEEQKAKEGFGCEIICSQLVSFECLLTSE